MQRLPLLGRPGRCMLRPPAIVGLEREAPAQVGATPTN